MNEEEPNYCFMKSCKKEDRVPRLFTKNRLITNTFKGEPSLTVILKK